MSTSPSIHQFIQRCQVVLGLSTTRDLATSLPALWNCLLSRPRSDRDSDRAAVCYATTCVARLARDRPATWLEGAGVPAIGAHAAAIRRSRANAALQFLVRHAPDHSMSLRTLSSNLQMSYCRVSRLLVAETRVGFHVHLHGLRMLHAVGRLATTDASIKEIAFDVGYERVSEFYRHFEPFVGMTPQEFGRMCRALPAHLAREDIAK